MLADGHRAVEGKHTQLPARSRLPGRDGPATESTTWHNAVRLGPAAGGGATGRVRMKIAAVETFVVKMPLARTFWMSHRPITSANEIVVRMRTDEGLVGTGAAHGSPVDHIGDLLQTSLAPLVVGEDPRNIERLWQKIFAVTYSRGEVMGQQANHQLRGAGRAEVMCAMAGIDTALWDLLGKIVGMPVWQLLGGYRNRVPAYVTCGYYEEGKGIDGLVREITGHVERGFRAVKMKIGGLPPAEDFQRVKAVREAVGPGVDIMVDGNQGWSVADAIEGGRMLEQLNVRWYEEPVHWYDDVDGLAQVAAHVRLPIASGESEYTKQGCRDLMARGAVRIMQFDSTKAGGLSEGRKVAALAEAYNVAVAPHHDPQVHAHLVAAIPNGLIVESFPDGDRDPIWDRLYRVKPRLADGWVELDDTPGFGYEVDDAALQRYGRRAG